MKNYKKDFPIFDSYSNLVFLDNGASTQKPKYVIDGISEFLKTGYANIHRGHYKLSQISEDLYNQSKKKVANFINADVKEIIYTYNSTYASNMLAEMFCYNGILKKGNKVLISVSEHHANIVPWQILQRQFGFEIDYVSLNDKFEIDLKDLESKLDDSVKVVSFQQVSNTTGTIHDLNKISKIIRKNIGSDIFFVVDASQSIPHFKIDVKKLDCDFLFFTAHKIMADTGIGVLYGKTKWLKKFNPVWGGGDMIKSVDKFGFTTSGLPTKFEPGTPNIIGAVSLLKALEYIDSIGGIKEIERHESKLIDYVLKKYNNLKNKFSDKKFNLIGKNKSDGRVGVFSFVIENISSKKVGEIMAKNDICIRTGGHCTHVLMNELDLEKGTFRMSLYIYNNFEDIDRFFDVFENILKLENIDLIEEDDELC